MAPSVGAGCGAQRAGRTASKFLVWAGAGLNGKLSRVTLRVLVAKVGLDGHDRGVKIVARILRDAGMEVVYTGLRQTPEMVTATAIDEDVDVIGLSMLSGAHMALAPRVVSLLREQDSDIPVVVGGIIPEQDIGPLIEAGVAEVLHPGASADEVAAAVRSATDD